MAARLRDLVIGLAVRGTPGSVLNGEVADCRGAVGVSPAGPPPVRLDELIVGRILRELIELAERATRKRSSWTRKEVAASRWQGDRRDTAGGLLHYAGNTSCVR